MFPKLNNTHLKIIYTRTFKNNIYLKYELFGGKAKREIV